MYDYLGGEQIKIFNHPIFNRNKENPDHSSYWLSCGRLRDFDKEDELPLKTLWYHYPENFMVFDYSWDFKDVWIVRNGKFDRLIPYTEVKPEQLAENECVFDYFGCQINIVKVSDFSAIKRDFQERIQAIKAMEKELFKADIYEVLRKNPTLYDENKMERERRIEEINARYKVWVVEETNKEEKEFGGLIDCYLYALSMKDSKTILHTSISPSEDYKACRLTLQRILNEKPDMVNRFKYWLQDDELFDSYQVETIANEILSNRMLL